MTYRAYFEKKLGGKAKVAKLPSYWHRHIERIDALPKAKKKLTAQKILEQVGA